MIILEPILYFGLGLFCLGLMLIATLYTWFKFGKRFKKDREKLKQKI